MKKILTICAVLLLTASVYAQTPEKMSYQAVVRNSSDALVSSQAVGMQISILQGSANGTAVYVETQTPTTNANGLVSLEIGEGTVVSGDFSTIDWANGPYFILTETDPTGGTNYTITGTSQLMSVPYALHAKSAENVVNDMVDDADADPTNEIELPTGGNSGQVLETDGNGNYAWVNQTVDTNTQLSEAEVDAYVANNGYVTTSNDADADPTNEIELPTGGNSGQVLETDGNGNYAWVNQTVDTNTQLSEAEVDAYVANNGYVTTSNDADADPTNEIELPTGGTSGQVLETDGNGNYAWVNQTSVDGSETNVIAGTNVTVSGSGTTSSPYVVSTQTRSIGQSYQGGIIFWVDATGQHGLIAATSDQGGMVTWSNGVNRIVGASGNGLYAGKMNTALIIAAQIADNTSGTFAAKVAADYSVTENGVTYGDWYLPSEYEMSLLYDVRQIFNGWGGGTVNYWTSTTRGTYNINLVNVWSGGSGATGPINNEVKNTTNRVRPIRAF